MRTSFSALLFCLAPAWLAGAPSSAAAQWTACSSDGKAAPRVLYERFLSADCATCWADAPATAPGGGALVLDWIVPGRQGDEAPLSAAATRDALERLQALRRAPPAATDTAITDVAPTAPLPGRLRVALGPPVNGYVGATIALARPGGKAPAAHARAGTRHAFTLLLVETVAAGAEGNAAERHIVRNALQGTWETGTAGPRAGWSELRPMRIPDGADAGRLGAVGWLQDTDGTVVAAARAHCPAADASRPQ
ncbi:hypothetical protein QRO11_07385 [Paracidovorax citrulli]|uniref:DUF1223 domain-containing protein n=2 Tax=Paracidovorax citrulli TaxID=80869 RepID=A1TNF8_PARC0|nr:hypothetical protein [Paracidovorax citrulli]ABM32496.1 conserved hypothetical protein [Paracidovorax citrulli AAC00-1]ATG93470.1 hypothetical protein CQB05_04990 [Paracidovorax citrulli]MVT27887.1 hypothetical protein [Paracidovorax citrulli]PVY66712.1 hypothetical protein C8E08_4134 [Paracidovorax citrulli]QCX09379.1 hypothetical protein APS58_0420 [Paracidovorax citrulli]